MNKKYYNKVLCALVEQERVQQEINAIDKIISDIKSNKANGYTKGDIKALERKRNNLTKNHKK